MSEVLFEGTPVAALLDTGSPVTIVPLDFVLTALAKNRPESQQLEDWKQGVKARLEPPTITLRNHGGGRINIVSQMRVQLWKGGHSVERVVQVQKGAQVNLLIGTDLQPALGFLFLDA